MDAIAVGSVAGLATYLGIILLIGYLAYRRNVRGDIDDRYLVGRSLGTPLLIGTLFATWFSTFAFLGGPGTFYLSGVNWLLFGFFNAMGPVLIWVFGTRMWALGRRYGLVTPGDLLAGYYDGSRRVRVLSALVGITVLFPYATIQLSGISKAVSGVTEGTIPYTSGILLVAIGVALYSVFGGSRAVVWTDAIQGIIFALLLITTAVLVTSWSGGWAEGWSSAVNAQPEQFVFTGDSSGAYFTLLVLWAFGWVLTPHLWQRMYMARSAQVLVKGAVLASVLALWVVTFMGAIIGFLGLGLVRDLPEGFDADALVPLIYAEFLPLMGIALVIAAFAAGMSTLDSQVISASSMFSLDIYEEAQPRATAGRLEGVGRGFEVLFVVGIVIFALLPGGQELIVPLASIGVGMALVYLMPLIGCLYWPRATEPAAFWSMLAGWTVMLTLQLTGATETLPWTFGPPAWGLFTSVAVFYAMSLMTKPVSAERQEMYHGYLAEVFGKPATEAQQRPSPAPGVASG